VVVAVGLRMFVLWDDPFAPGYDGYYYVLQVQSGLTGDALFADKSTVYAILQGLTRVIGDVVTANKVAACLFGGLTTVGGAVAALRWTQSPRAMVAVGWLWAVSPLHLAISAEYLKNAAGLAVLSGVLALLPRVERSRGQLAGLALAVVCGLATHKLTGVFGVVACLAYASIRVLQTRRLPMRSVVGGVVVLAMAATLGVFRVVDVDRFMAGLGRTGSRWAPFIDGRMSWGERTELGLVYLAPLLFLVAWIRTREPDKRAMVGALSVVAVTCTAPFLPVAYDLTAWRLMLMGFIPAAFAVVVVAERSRLVLVGAVVTMGLLAVPAAVQRREREPDYASFVEVVPLIQEVVPVGGRLVAHRGLCGFLWVHTERVCENFQPQGDLTQWWRVVYGFGPVHLEPYGTVVGLRPAYTLMREDDYQRFREVYKDRYDLLSDASNPYEVRPGFVYGPPREQ
jgi:hypothetical protein